ncbi:MAG: hypothetical protein A2846_01630 [Candidatus Doudnabacteria bacterium RIFCSPHIGHO2_01_FULL_49_9]|uniref:Type II secretion system protein GspG C-terminal domain-containing protein n=1 Tax=Candidatus Doudnabacteria bacterium RIFCSPHIGHO2_01_FULL_49_9 TaxID=1817827 RepID=A0A1F5P394_9BACT|nr:MAG: hypothetical protein A2846_01630 [Candidatus Doudnabacteria bacterium RIFCSPHIGHO2_01_FULL_49_9]
MKIKTHLGFTILELLVVISIIGLLSSMVMASARSARQKASMARLAGDMHQISTQADIARDSANDTLIGITGNGCSMCLFNTTQSVTSQTGAVAQNAAGWQSLGFNAAPSDPWGNPYLLDENEYEAGWAPCRHDMAISAGSNRIWAGFSTIDVSRPAGYLYQGPDDDLYFLLSYYSSCS